MTKKLVLSGVLSLLINNGLAHFAAHPAGVGQSKANLMTNRGETFHQSLTNIRKMHPEFLLHKRDQTLRQGIRSKKYSLKGCIDCHAHQTDPYNESIGSYHPVNNSGQFCADCHQKVSVSMDCFGCHRTTPSKKENQ